MTKDSDVYFKFLSKNSSYKRKLKEETTSLRVRKGFVLLFFFMSVKGHERKNSNLKTNRLPI